MITSEKPSDSEYKGNFIFNELDIVISLSYKKLLRIAENIKRTFLYKNTCRNHGTYIIR